VRRKDQREILDVSALRMREATISAGIWLTYGVGILGEVYVALTWQRPYRPELAVLFAMAVVAGFAVSLLPPPRIVRSRFREPFFLTWTVMDFVLIVLGTLADGGTQSPIVLVFFLPVVFSSMSYPLGSVATVGVFAVLSYLGVALSTGGASATFQGVFAGALACTAGMSGWHARNHNRQHDALADASRADPLTGCLNRRGFEERAIAEIDDMGRRARQGAVLVLDLDHFKPVNDRYGHAAGDELLCWVVQALKEVVRPVDAVGRLGGDEFAVLFPEIEPQDARRSAARIARVLSERAPSSMGLAIFPDDGTDLEALARRADMRLYASREGRPETEFAPAAWLEELGPAGAQASVRASQAREFSQSTLDSLSTRVAVLDEHGAIVSANASWRALAAGEGVEDCVGSNYLQACEAWEDPAGARIAQGLREMLSQQRPRFELEYSSQGPTSRRSLLMRATRQEGPGPLRLVVAHEDVSEGRQAREGASMQAALLDQIDAAVIVTDLDGTVRSWNSGAESLYGWTREEAVGRDAMELIVPEDSAPAQRLVAELRRDSRWDGEFLLRRKDGSTFTSYVRNRVICDEDGRPTALVGVSVDISVRVAAESELVQARDYAQAVAECMGEGLFTLDVDGRVTYVNPAAEHLLGWPRAELYGRVMHEVIHRRSPDGSKLTFEECPITKSLRDGAMVRIEDDIFIVRSGRELPVAYTSTPFATGGGVQGCVVIFQDVAARKQAEAEQRSDAETLACINRVEDAIAEDRFVLYAQPIVDLRTGETVQHELLLRMRERDGQLVAPGAFLHVAEQYALIGEIDWWVIKCAAQIAASGCPVELNISARSIGDLDVLEHIERSIEQTGADPANLVFEITETAIVEDEAAARRFAERLHLAGCKLALDDFGTGYGGFTYLKQIPVDYLKIDIEFVRDLLTNRASSHVVQAVVALAHDFDLETVAEGVEDPATLELLRELGVDFAQGYHIARPAPFRQTPGDEARVTDFAAEVPRPLAPSGR
jgi:diguanylate cyclase (GGDEF)-like protein/PAS domain S-box-containing protein